MTNVKKVLVVHCMNWTMRCCVLRMQKKKYIESLKM